MRCKACNAPVTVRWDSERGQFEELCNTCLGVVERMLGGHLDDISLGCVADTQPAGDGHGWPVMAQGCSVTGPRGGDA